MGKSCKVVVCGQASVGKTSILEQLLYGNHVVGECGSGQRPLRGSPGCSRQAGPWAVGIPGQCRLWGSLGRVGCGDPWAGPAVGIPLCGWSSGAPLCLLEQVTIVVLGNKCDLQEQRRVDHDAAQHWAKGEKVKLWEVSVADRRTLIEPFIYLASKMTQPQSKSAFPLSHKNKGSGSMDG
ncbi:KBRS2 protein, partial [Chloropsis cyanopogon]|nr:KBRS2 protein [Chloropsis cyanopogon]